MTITCKAKEELPCLTENDVSKVRQVVRKWAIDAKFSLVDQTKIVTAASELARNTVIHGKGGTAMIELIEDGFKLGLKLTFVDHGPGIPDINLALRDGFTTGSGMGLGLSGSKRLTNDFFIESKPGVETIVSATKWK